MTAFERDVIYQMALRQLAAAQVPPVPLVKPDVVVVVLRAAA